MGVADVGIVGLNEVAEKGFTVEQVMDLGFGGCRISLAVPKSTPYEGPTSSAASASPPPTPTSSPATSPSAASRPRSTPSRGSVEIARP